MQFVQRRRSQIHQDRRKLFKDMQTKESTKAETVSEMKEEMYRVCEIRCETNNLKL